jgi:cytochrome c556
MIRLLSVLACFAVTATFAWAQNHEAIKQRKQVMQSNLETTKAGGAMVKGDIPFDLVRAQALVKTYQSNALQLRGLFPDDSKSGETRAQPEIWTRKSDFLLRLDKFSADATAAVAAVRDDGTFKSEFGKVTANCVACHREFQRPLP